MSRMLLSCAALLGSAVPAAAQCLEQQLTPPPGAFSFGTAVEILGDELFVGDPSNHGQGPHGAVSCFERDALSGEWLESQTVRAGSGQPGSFGSALAYDGGDLFIGAARESSVFNDGGAVYVNRRTGPGGPWDEVQVLRPSVQHESQQFGLSLAVDGDTLVVGAPFENQPPQTWIGAAYVFERDSVTQVWSETARFPWQGPGGWQLFASEVSVSGDWMAAGSHHIGTAGGQRGEVHLFRRVQGTWTAHTVIAGPVQSNAGYGNSVELLGEWLLVGTRELATGGTGRVRVYRFDGVADAWVETGEVERACFAGTFGSRLDFDADSLLVGSATGPAAQRFDFDPLTGEFTFVRYLTWAGEAHAAAVLAADGEYVVLGIPGGWGGAAQVLGETFCTELGQRYCTPATANSSGRSARLDTFGNTTLAQGLFTLRASQLPRDAVGFFLASRVTGQQPVAAGTLCLGAPIVRFWQYSAEANFAGFFERTLNLGHLPTYPVSAVQPGETWHFQAWFRDGATSNFTDASSVTFD